MNFHLIFLNAQSGLLARSIIFQFGDLTTFFCFPNSPFEAAQNTMATQRPGLPKWPCASERCRFLDWIMKSQKKIWLGDRTNIKLRFHNFCWFELVTGYRKGLNVTPPLLQRGSGGEREHKILYCPFCLVEIGVMDRVAFDLDMGPQSEAPRSVKDFVS